MQIATSATIGRSWRRFNSSNAAQSNSSFKTMNEPQSKPDPVPPSTQSTICLDDYLKACGIVETGGQAKIVIQTGRVRLNGVVETRRRKKLVAGDVLHVDDMEFVIEED